MITNEQKKEFTEAMLKSAKHFYRCGKEQMSWKCLMLIGMAQAGYSWEDMARMCGLQNN